MISVALDTSTGLLKRGLRDTRVRLLFGFAISLTLGWLSVKGMDWGLVIDQFHDFPVGWAVASLGVVILASFFRAYRWQMLFVEHRVPLMRLFMVQNAGIGLNNLSPVRVASEPTQFALLTLRYGVKGGVALATLSMERILDMVVTATLLMAGLTLLPNTGDFLPYVTGAFVVAMGSVLAVPFLIWARGKRFLNRIPILVATADFLSDMTKAKVALAYSFLLTLIHWLLVGVCAWVLAYGMGLEITAFVATIAILGTLYFATSVPSLPAAAGTFEFAIVYVLKVFDVPQDLAFGYGVVLHAVIFLPPIVVAIAVLSTMGLRPLNQSNSSRPLKVGGTAFIDGLERKSE